MTCTDDFLSIFVSTMDYMCNDVGDKVWRSLYVTCVKNSKSHSVGERMKFRNICSAYVVVTNTFILECLECLVLENKPKRAMKRECVHLTTHTSERQYAMSRQILRSIRHPNARVYPFGSTNHSWTLLSTTCSFKDDACHLL